MLTAKPAPDIGLRNLTLGYERHPAVHHLSVALPAGDLVAVVGPNGAGKSTLVKALAGLVRPMQGHIEGLSPTRHGLLRRSPGVRVAYLPQQAEMDRSFPIAVADMVAMGLWHELGALGRLNAGHRQRVDAALAAVGLSGFGHRTIGTLSGGQFQRALFARLLLQDAPVILLDEPFVGVDARTVRDLMQLLLLWHTQGRTVLAVLHDLDLVREHFPTTWLLARELVAAGPTASVLTEAHQQRARELNEAFDEHAPACDVPEAGAAHPTPAPGHGHDHDHTHPQTHAHRHPHAH